MIYPVSVKGSTINTLIYFLLRFIEDEDQHLCIILTNSANRIQIAALLFLILGSFVQVIRKQLKRVCKFSVERSL